MLSKMKSLSQDFSMLGLCSLLRVTQRSCFKVPCERFIICFEQQPEEVGMVWGSSGWHSSTSHTRAAGIYAHRGGCMWQRLALGAWIFNRTFASSKASSPIKEIAPFLSKQESRIIFYTWPNTLSHMCVSFRNLHLNFFTSH